MSSLPEGWDLLASSLGLEIVDGGLQGTVEGHRVRAQSRYDKQGYLVTQVVASLAPAMDLGLDLHRVSVSLPLPGAITLGSPDLDDEFRLSGDQPRRVRAFFTERLRERLVAVNQASYDIGLSDEHCRIYVLQQEADERWMEGAVRHAAALVGLMEEARAGLPPAAPLVPHGRALAALAASRALVFRAAPLGLHGRVDGAPIAVSSRRTGRRRHEIAAHAELEPHLGVGLSVRRAGLLDGVRTLLGGQDVTVGEEPFDKRFVVRAEPAHERRAAALLSPDVRAALLEIDARAGGVEVDDRGVAVRAASDRWEPETLAWLVDALPSVARRIAQNLLQGTRDNGPYR